MTNDLYAQVVSSIQEGFRAQGWMEGENMAMVTVTPEQWIEYNMFTEFPALLTTLWSFMLQMCSIEFLWSQIYGVASDVDNPIQTRERKNASPYSLLNLKVCCLVAKVVNQKYW